MLDHEPSFTDLRLQNRGLVVGVSAAFGTVYPGSWVGGRIGVGLRKRFLSSFLPKTRIECASYVESLQCCLFYAETAASRASVYVKCSFGLPSSYCRSWLDIVRGQDNQDHIPFKLVWSSVPSCFSFFFYPGSQETSLPQRRCTFCCAYTSLLHLALFLPVPIPVFMLPCLDDNDKTSDFSLWHTLLAVGHCLPVPFAYVWHP